MALISASSISLTLPIYRQREELAKSWFETLANAALHRPRREFTTIIHGVSFEIKEGDRVALIGRNGSGKSTLLHLLTGAYRPTSGSLRVEGSRQALMNISLGFNGHATVLENIYLRATAMGIQISQIQPHLRSILEFAGIVDKAADRLRTLSAGQRMRLGFAISTAIQHDIVLLDEWIGAGDAEFLRRARNRMRSQVDGSKIVVVASHNFKLVRRLCNRALLLDDGRIIQEGTPNEVIARYRGLIDANAITASAE